MGLETDHWGSCSLRAATKKWILLFPTLVINCAHLDEENPQVAQVKSKCKCLEANEIINMFSLVGNQ